MSERIFHLTRADDWKAAEELGIYKPASYEVDRFIHCSRASQLLRVAYQFFAHQQRLVVLTIDPGRLTAPLRWEQGVDKPDELFPHLYGALNLDAVIGVWELDNLEDGSFQIPKGRIDEMQAL